MAGRRVTRGGAGSSGETIQAMEARDGSSGRPLGPWVRDAGAEWGGGRGGRQGGGRRKRRSQREGQKGRWRQRESEQAGGWGSRPGEGVRALAGWGEEV